MYIPSLGPAPPVRATGATPAPIPPVRPVSAPAPLTPAVQVDIRDRERANDPRTGTAPTSERADDSRSPVVVALEPRIRIDRDTEAVVYQEVDPGSGDVVMQLPDPVVLKTRAYAEAAEARARPSAHPVDRTA
ncbi:hypothetical protein [Methylobacterium goesingense]|uniref:hypothetical protein n=1 Tax=Methylobacterium goesingense TaxID=243690 RepID=UPI00208654D6|nr:hypothetical protein CFIICLFH_2927 [Methylobacterium goesingense]